MWSVDSNKIYSNRVIFLQKNILREYFIWGNFAARGKKRNAKNRARKKLMRVRYLPLFLRHKGNAAFNILVSFSGKK